MRLFGGRKMKPQFIHMLTSSGYIILDHNGVETFFNSHLNFNTTTISHDIRLGVIQQLRGTNFTYLVIQQLRRTNFT